MQCSSLCLCRHIQVCEGDPGKYSAGSSEKTALNFCGVVTGCLFHITDRLAHFTW